MHTEKDRVVDRLYPRVRETLHQIRPYVPGRPAADVMREFGLADVVKLASNENPFGTSPRAREAVFEAAREMHRYPDGATTSLRKAIAAHLALNSDQVLVSNGSDEMIKMVSETFLQPGDEVVAPFPSFAQYGFGANVMGAKMVHAPLTPTFFYDVDALLARITERTKIVYLCSPNNPTGTWLTHAQAESYMARVPDHVLTVFDEAYVEYVDAIDPLDTLRWVREGRAVLSFRTFSKMYGLAGLRLGYALGNPGILSFIEKVREPFNANALAQCAAEAALLDTAFVEMVRRKTKEGRRQLEAGVQALGYHTVPSQGNFSLVYTGNGRETFERLQRLGVIVRAGFPGLDAYIRVSIGTFEENERFLQALATLS